MFVSAESCPFGISVFDGDGVMIENCFEIDTETGVGIAYFNGKPMANRLVDFAVLDFEAERVARCRCEWKKPIELRSKAGSRITTNLEMLVVLRFQNLANHQNLKAKVFRERQIGKFREIENHLSDMKNDLKIAIHELQSFTFVCPDS